MDKPSDKNIKTQRGPNGTEYVFEDSPYWDKNKKQNRHKRTYIGKMGSDGTFIPNKRYLVRLSSGSSVCGAPPPKTAFRLYCGATHLLDEIGARTGVAEDLRFSFPDFSEELLSLAYYLVLESDSPMYRFGRWAHDHFHPYGRSITSQRISEIMRDISENGKMSFFQRQARRQQDKEYLAYDTTSVSSWSEYIRAVRYGRNKDGDSLPQVNMALVFGEESALPVYYRILPGNIADVSTVKKLLKDVSFLELDKLKLVLDRGFYSADNINALYKGRHKFLISVKAGIKFVAGFVKDAKQTIREFRNYDEALDVYKYSVMSKWPYAERDRSGQVTLKEDRRIYVHVYYNGTRAEEEKQRFVKSLSATKAALISGNELSDTQKNLCEDFFMVKRTPERGLQVAYNEEAIEQHMDNLGYFVLLSNDLKDSAVALDTYRRKDMVEKAFDNLKERLDMKRTSVHSDETLQGRFFLQFLALIFVSYIHKQMRDNNLYRNYTMQTMLDSLDVIERFEYKGQNSYCSEVTNKQKLLYACFNSTGPYTL